MQLSFNKFAFATLIYQLQKELLLCHFFIGFYITASFTIGFGDELDNLRKLLVVLCNRSLGLFHFLLQIHLLLLERRTSHWFLSTFLCCLLVIFLRQSGYYTFAPGFASASSFSLTSTSSSRF